MNSKKNKAQVYVVDTSVILEDSDNISLLSQDGNNRIIIPETVLDELDNRKKGFEAINYQARAFNRFLDKFSIVKTNTEKGITKTELQWENIKIEVYAKDKYEAECLDGQTSIYNDRKILEIAKQFPKAIVVTNDVALRIRAASYGLKAEPLKKDRVENVDSISFIETFKIHSSQKDLIHEMKPEDFGRKLSQFTNCEFICEDTDQHILALYKMGKFYCLNEQKLRSLVVKPKNKEQLFFLNMLLDPDLPIVVVAGCTGSGKNLLAMQGAIEYQRKNNSDMNINYCRNTVTAGDANAQLGFLKGDENQKLGVFTYPLLDAVDFYKNALHAKNIENKKPLSISTQAEFMEHHNIQPLNINQMRGSNLHGYLIFDEWQSASSSVNKLMLTRISEGSKVVILGDLNQIDNAYLNKYNNALAIMLKQVNESDMIGGIQLTRVLRGQIADYADKNL